MEFMYNAKMKFLFHVSIVKTFLYTDVKEINTQSGLIIAKQSQKNLFKKVSTVDTSKKTFNIDSTEYVNEEN